MALLQHPPSVYIENMRGSRVHSLMHLTGVYWVLCSLPWHESVPSKKYPSTQTLQVVADPVHSTHSAEQARMKAIEMTHILQLSHFTNVPIDFILPDFLLCMYSVSSKLDIPKSNPYILAANIHSFSTWKYTQLAHTDTSTYLPIYYFYWHNAKMTRLQSNNGACWQNIPIQVSLAFGGTPMISRKILAQHSPCSFVEWYPTLCRAVLWTNIYWSSLHLSWFSFSTSVQNQKAYLSTSQCHQSSSLSHTLYRLLLFHYIVHTQMSMLKSQIKACHIYFAHVCWFDVWVTWLHSMI